MKSQNSLIRNRKRRFNRASKRFAGPTGFSFECLETRQLLAADFGILAFPTQALIDQVAPAMAVQQRAVSASESFTVRWTLECPAHSDSGQNSETDDSVEHDPTCTDIVSLDSFRHGIDDTVNRFTATDGRGQSLGISGASDGGGRPPIISTPTQPVGQSNRVPATTPGIPIVNINVQPPRFQDLPAPILAGDITGGDATATSGALEPVSMMAPIDSELATSVVQVQVQPNSLRYFVSSQPAESFGAQVSGGKVTARIGMVGHYQAFSLVQTQTPERLQLESSSSDSVDRHFEQENFELNDRLMESVIAEHQIEVQDWALKLASHDQIDRAFSQLKLANSVADVNSMDVTLASRRVTSVAPPSHYVSLPLVVGTRGSQAESAVEMLTRVENAAADQALHIELLPAAFSTIFVTGMIASAWWDERVRRKATGPVTVDDPDAAKCRLPRVNVE